MNSQKNYDLSRHLEQALEIMVRETTDSFDKINKRREFNFTNATGIKDEEFSSAIIGYYDNFEPEIGYSLGINVKNIMTKLNSAKRVNHFVNLTLFNEGRGRITIQEY